MPYTPPGNSPGVPFNRGRPQPPIAPQLPTSQFGNPGSFTGAANQQASDYDKIMEQYDTLIKNSASNPIAPGKVGYQDVQTPGNAQFSSNANRTNFTPIKPQTSQYNQSSDVSNSLAGLSNLATTGGYSDADKQDIRARDISPIRSIYANAQQNAERSRTLGGGYSPNFNAVQAQMARDEANKIGDVTSSANAGIAENVAKNRLSAAPAYASASANANSAQTEADRHNADIINQINEFNAQGNMQNNQFNSSNANEINKFNISTQNANAQGNANRRAATDQFNVQAALDAAKMNQGNTQAAISGKTNLYGTTPALTSLFGNQVIQAGQLGQGQQQLNNQKFGTIANAAGGMSSGGGRWQS